MEAYRYENGKSSKIVTADGVSGGMGLMQPQVPVSGTSP